MAVVMYHEPSAMSTDQYDTVTRKLEEAGAGDPDGRQHHFAFYVGEGRLAVMDVWDSEEKFQEFGPTIGPILAEVGVDGEPQFGQLHNEMHA
jgi:hypothetical protein